MDLRKVGSLLTVQDPALIWIRQQDAPRAKRTTTRMAIVALLLIPLCAIRPPAYGSDATSLALSFSGLFTGVLLFAVLIGLALNIDRQAFVRYQILELAAWFLVVSLIAQIGHDIGAARVGAPSFDLDSKLTPKGVDNLTTKVMADIRNASTVAWFSNAYAGLGFVIASRGLPSKPIALVLFIAACLLDIIVADEAYAKANGAIYFLVALGAAIAFLNFERYRRWLEFYRQHCASTMAKESDNLLLANFLPETVRIRVSRNERVADSFSNLTVIFADMVGFTSLSRRVSPGHLVDVLNEIFAAGDEIATECGIEKVKTIGDCYMAVAGGVASTACGAADAVRFAQRYLGKVEEVSLRLDIPLALRVGIHTGPAVGGIIGTSRPAYDYWGDTVNLASRLESASGAGRILVSEATWLQIKRDFEFEDGTDIEAKGVGTVRSHFVAQTRPEANIVPLVKRSN